MQYTHSERAAFKFCRRNWFLSYRALLKPRVESMKLTLGSAVHAWLAEYLLTRNPSPEPFVVYYEQVLNELPYGTTRETIAELNESEQLGLAMITGFPAWHESQEEVIWLEQAEVQFAMGIPRTCHNLQGKVDGVCRRQGELWVAEHKTAAAVGADYEARLYWDEQIPAYLWAIERSYGEPVGGVVYTVLRKQAPSKRVKNPLYYRFFVSLTDWQEQAFELDLVGLAAEMEDPIIYSNPNRDCKWKCAFQDLCDCSLDDYSGYARKTSAHTELEEV